ncbi:uncharacterized protein A4U43_C08F18850 [Asparagus officinalis]|uniref:23 kDa jasmonate-induced protein-like n=1 Tax=Asparagus officinalis TaxID=4686 RepID=UPI00098E6B59|nr:23 kDa jasmonate-induced protein-like [Asparagus officinalis]ONK60472.1 uncharacterized protein A4U43_C08F18850 [Asparagus officinalis]
MAGRVVFGVPVTNEALKLTAKYADKEISQLDRATEALNKKDEALPSIEEMEKLIPGQGPTTICMLYNATGAPIYFVTDKNWHGYLKSPKFPEKIENGQWGVFSHSSGEN